MCKLNSLYVVIMVTQRFVRVAVGMPNTYKLTHLDFKILALTKTQQNQQ